MNKTFLTAAAVVAMTVLMAGSALATQSRINGMSGKEKSFTIRDQANIYFLPQMLVFHGNEVDVDETNGNKYGTMNIRYKLTDDAVLLLYGKRSPWKEVVTKKSLGVTGTFYDAGSIAGFTPKAAEPTNHQFGIGFGTRLGEAARLGTTISLGGHNDSRDANNIQDNTWFELDVGFGFDLSETDNLDLALHLGFGAFTNVENTERYVSAGLVNFGLMGKGEFQVHQIAALVPYIGFNYDTRSVEHVATDACGAQSQICAGLKGNVNTTTIALGADLAIKPAEGVLVQPGLGIDIMAGGADGNKALSPNAPIVAMENSTVISPHYGFAAEARAFDWLNLRLGARQTVLLMNNSNTLPPAPAGAPPQSNERHSSQVLNTVTTGVGINLRGWTIDVNMNPMWFNNGPFLATGNATPGWGMDFAMMYKW